MRSIKQIGNIKGKTVMVRVDFNLPIKDGVVEDDFRIKKTLPTIDFLQKKGAKIVLISHLGKGGDTLLPIAKVLNKHLKASFVEEVVGPKVEKAVETMKPGDILLLENLRNDPGEKDCNKVFAMNLARLADIYVNEAFPVAHRGDASIVLLPKLLPGFAGLQLVEEVENLSRAFHKPKHPFLFILGGAKFSTKLPLIQKYLELADEVFVGGALANDFSKAQGREVGKSLVSDDSYGIEKLLKNKKLVLPVDVVVKSGDNFVNKKADEVAKDEIILDIGEESVNNLGLLIKKSEFILWNGPLGKYEAGGSGATKKVLELMAQSKAESIIGGGDLVSVLSSLKPSRIEPKDSIRNELKPNLFVSTGGGATLEFLMNGTLPGIEALK